MNGLKKHVGPLPVWGWGAAIALGVLIFYWQRHSSGGQVAMGQVVADPTLDPTQGSFPMPDGISSGGLSPELSGPSAADIADAVGANLIPVLSSLPYASAPGEPSNPGDQVAATLATLQAFKDAGLVSTMPATSTGAAASAPQKHTAPKHVSERTTQKGVNSKSGKTYRVVQNPHGKPHGTYHVYGSGKHIRYVKVKK